MTILTAPETYNTAVNPRSLSAIIADLKARLTASDFSPDTWSEADYKTAIMMLVADVREGDEQIRSQVVKGGFLQDAEQPWLSLLAAGFFQIVPREATQATIRLRLTDTANIARSPFSSPLVAVWNPEDPDASLYFASAAGVVIPKNGFVDVEFLAERPGSAYNVVPGSVTNLVTPIPGVALTSPAIPGTGSIVVTPGTDAESDESIVQACEDKWSLLRRGWSARTIRALLRDLIPEATRVYVRDDNPLPGEAWVYMATATGTITAARIVEAYNYFRSEDIKPLSNKPLRFFSATPVVYTLEGTVYTDGDASSLLLGAQRLAAYMFDYPLGKSIYREALEEALRSPTEGVQAATITNIPPVLTTAPTESVQFLLDMTVAPAELFK
jgi:hypothetical protein